MSSRNWIICDVTEETASVRLCGSVDLENANAVATSPAHHVESPCDSVAGGMESHERVAQTQRDLRYMIKPWVLNFAVIVGIVAVCYILFLDGWRENITFVGLLSAVTSFIAGRSTASLKKGKAVDEEKRHLVDA